jgi:hypothetical protein
MAEPMRKVIGANEVEGEFEIEQDPVYKDKLIEISHDFLLLKNYYVPFGNPKRVPFEEIESVTAEKPSLSVGKWRIWGTGNLTSWFPLDFARPRRDLVFMVCLRGKTIRVGFTAENSEAVVRIFEQRGLLHHRTA